MANKRRVYLWADAGMDIGYGHFIRTLALAGMLKDEFDCTMFTRTPTEYQLREAESVCKTVALPADDSRFSQFLKRLNGNEIVVLDNYFFTSEYQRRIKEKGCKLVCIDDMHDRHFHADLIISQCTEDCSVYDAEKETKYCMGVRWALLRKPFLTGLRKRPAGHHWVISFGGSDPDNLTLKYAACLKSLPSPRRISVMVGDAYPHLRTLRGLSGIEVHRNLNADEVADLFRSADSVICSASSVCYEALSCGCKVYVGYYVDNQVGFYRYLTDKGAIRPLGYLLDPVRLKIDFVECHAPFEFTGMPLNYRLVFRALSLNVVNYTEMSRTQSRSIWTVRNMHAICRWMDSQEAFSFESHCRFVEGLKGDAAKLYYAFFNGDVCIGSYDFVDIKDGESAERGLFVNPEYQGSGVALMMERYMDCEIVKRKVHTLHARILRQNLRSYRYHIKAGYRMSRETATHYLLEREI